MGGTRLGKSVLTVGTLKRVGKLLGVAGFLEVTVEDSDQMDLV